jgi:hypothetical protein
MVNVTGKFLPFNMDPGLIGGPPKQRPAESIVGTRPATAPSTATKAAFKPRRTIPKRTPS